MPIEKGGTGATTAAQARTNLGLTNGPTKPRYNRLTHNGPNLTYTNLIPLTSGAGYLHAVNVFFASNGGTSYAQGCNIEVTIDGGTAQVISCLIADFTNDPSLTPGVSSGFIPLHLRFNTSLLVRGTRTGGSAEVLFAAAWALD